MPHINYNTCTVDTVDVLTGEITDRKPFFKTPYNHDTNAESNRVALTCLDESKTQQHFKNEVDINVIISRFMKTGLLPHVQLPPTYGEFSNERDYHSDLQRIQQVNAVFYKLDADVRQHYNNDPGTWLKDVQVHIDTGNREGLRAMGLDVPDPPEPTPPTPETGGPAAS